MVLYVSCDADDAGKLIGRARLADDVEEVRRTSARLDRGLEILKSWALSVGGSVVEAGGDECSLEVPADHIGELPAVREQYADAVKCTLSVGVGVRLAESAKALYAAKLRGKDQIVFYSPECDELIKEGDKQGQPEAEKLRAEYLDKAEHASGVECPACGAAGHGDNGVQHHTDGRAEPLECTSCGQTGTYEDFGTEAPKPKKPKLKKAAPAMNAGANAGFAGVTMPAAPSVDQPVPSQGDHEEAQVALDTLGLDEGAQSPEMTHAAKDYERQLHDEAWKGEEEDMAGSVDKRGRLDQVKQQVAQALQLLKLKAPVLEQVRQVDPDAYKATMALVQSVIALAREASDTPGTQPIAKAEGDFNDWRPVQGDRMCTSATGKGVAGCQSKAKLTRGRNHYCMVHAKKRGYREPDIQKAEGVKDRVRQHTKQIQQVLSEDLLKPEFQGGKHCLSGHCYVASEALYHLLGGKEAGWTPHVVQHDGGPHWFLKHASGRIADPTAAQFSTPPPYDRGRGQGFLTYPVPSDRARQVMERMLTEQSLRPEDAAGLTGEKQLAKMAILDIPPGRKVRSTEGSTWNYKHVLSPPQRAAGYSIKVAQEPRFGQPSNAYRAKLYHGDEMAGNVGFMHDPANRTIHVKYSEIHDGHRGKGLGTAMYEAAYAHARHALGATHVVGEEHSTSAKRVHESLSRKHGMFYEPHDDSGEGDDQEADFDGRYNGYRYAIKSEPGDDSLSKAVKAAKKPQKLAAPPASEREELVHYSVKPGLKTIGVDHMGTGAPGAEYKQGIPEVGRAYYYRAGSAPEPLVTQGAKARYTAHLDPAKHRLYDLGADPEGLRAPARERFLSGEGLETPEDTFLDAVKQRGYYGYHNSASAMPHVVALFHAHPVSKGEDLGKSDESDWDTVTEESKRNATAGYHKKYVVGTKVNTKTGHVKCPDCGKRGSSLYLGRCKTCHSGELNKATPRMPPQPVGASIAQAPAGAAGSAAAVNKIKVQHSDGSTGTKQVEAGVIRSMDPSEHGTSSRSPNSK